MNMNDELIRDYEHGDEKHIVRMHNGIFGAGRTLERWRWQFEDHIQGRGWITLAEVGGEIVGQYCMMRNHLNFRGREVVAGQSCDTMVRQDQRRRNWFTRLAERNYTDAAGKGVAAVFGFPNSESYHGITSRLGWRIVFNLKRYFYRVGFGRVWGSEPDRLFKYLHGIVIRSRLAGRRISGLHLEVAVSSRLPDGLEDCLNAIRDREVLSVWKDVPYLRWRYEEHPDNRYTFHVLTVEGRPVGLAVTRERGVRILICDLLSRNKDISQAAFLLLHIVNYYQRSDTQLIEFYGHDSGFFDAAFSTCGFKARASSDFVFGGRVFNNPEICEVFRSPVNWTIAYGDVDVI